MYQKSQLKLKEILRLISQVGKEAVKNTCEQFHGPDAFNHKHLTHHSVDLKMR